MHLTSHESLPGPSSPTVLQGCPSSLGSVPGSLPGLCDSAIVNILGGQHWKLLLSLCKRIMAEKPENKHSEASVEQVWGAQS